MKDLMTKLAVVATASAALSFAVSDSASAAAFNNRPVTIGASTDGSPTLQQVFNTIGASPLNAANNQSNVALFNFANNPGATVVIEVAGNANKNAFGIYNPSNIGQKVQLFGGLANAGDTVNIQFTGTGIKINGGAEQTFSSNVLGFYLSNLQDKIGPFYTEDDKNGNKAQALVYEGNGKTLTIKDADTGKPVTKSFNPDVDWLIAWEDKKIGSGADGDYQDMVVLVKDFKAVPEPLTMLGVGTAIGFGGFFKRELAKKQKKDKTKA